MTICKSCGKWLDKEKALEFDDKLLCETCYEVYKSLEEQAKAINEAE